MLKFASMAKCLEAALTGFLEVPKAGQGVETIRDFHKKIRKKV